MDNERQETIADIVREMHNLGRIDEKSTDKIPRSLQALELRTYADRIETAAKREREATSENSSQVGNAAKMRDAPEEQMERIVRDAILSYEQLYKDAPNDDSEREIRERCAIANGWLVSNGFARQAVSFDKEESPNL